MINGDEWKGERRAMFASPEVPSADGRKWSTEEVDCIVLAFDACNGVPARFHAEFNDITPGRARTLAELRLHLPRVAKVRAIEVAASFFTACDAAIDGAIRVDVASLPSMEPSSQKVFARSEDDRYIAELEVLNGERQSEILKLRRDLAKARDAAVLRSPIRPQKAGGSWSNRRSRRGASTMPGLWSKVPIAGEFDLWFLPAGDEEFPPSSYWPSLVRMRRIDGSMWAWWPNATRSTDHWGQSDWEWVPASDLDGWWHKVAMPDPSTAPKDRVPLPESSTQAELEAPRMNSIRRRG